MWLDKIKIKIHVLIARKAGSFRALQKRCKELVSGLPSLTVILENRGRESRVGWGTKIRVQSLDISLVFDLIQNLMTNPPHH